MSWAIRKTELQRCNSRPCFLEGPTQRLITECGIRPGNARARPSWTGAVWRRRYADRGKRSADRIGRSASISEPNGRAGSPSSAPPLPSRSQRDIRRRRRESLAAAWTIRRGDWTAGAVHQPERDDSPPHSACRQAGIVAFLSRGFDAEARRLRRKPIRALCGCIGRGWRASGQRHR